MQSASTQHNDGGTAIEKTPLSRRGAVVARRFPKAKVASSTLVGGIPVSIGNFGWALRCCLCETVEESFLDTLSAQESGKVRRSVLLMPLAKVCRLCSVIVDDSSVARSLPRQTLRSRRALFTGQKYLYNTRHYRFHILLFLESPIKSSYQLSSASSPALMFSAFLQPCPSPWNRMYLTFFPLSSNECKISSAWDGGTTASSDPWRICTPHNQYTSPKRQNRSRAGMV